MDPQAEFKNLTDSYGAGHDLYGYPFVNFIALEGATLDEFMKRATFKHQGDFARLHKASQPVQDYEAKLEALSQKADSILGKLSDTLGKRSRYGSEYGGISRDPDKQNSLRKLANAAYDNKCCVSGQKEEGMITLTATHIVSLEHVHGVGSQLSYSLKNCVLLSSVLEICFDRHEWYFEENGDIVVLWDKSSMKEVLKKFGRANLATGENAPSASVIAYKKELALKHFQFACPDCWRENRNWDIRRLEEHRRHSCPATKAQRTETKEADGEVTSPWR